jgi:hypothetical protein
MAREYVAEITVYDDTVPGERVLRFTSGLGFTTRATDTPANTLIEGRVRQPALVRRDVFDAGTTGGPSRVGFGELVLANEDGALDAFATYGLDGRELVVRIGDPDTAYPAAWGVLFTGTMEQAETTLDAVTIRLRDRQAFTTLPLQRTVYAGNNALPNGVEGTSDLEGKPKPVLLGWCYNLEPVLVNTSRLAYQVHDGAIRDVMAVYDSGALLGRGPDYADTAALLATPPAPGTYRVCKSEGLFRLGSAPIGQVTCDAVQGTTPDDRTAAALFRAVLEDRAGIAPTAISSADLAALSAVQSAQLGFYYRTAVTMQAVLDDIATTVGAWWGTDTAGQLRLVRLDAPSGAPVLSVGPSDLRTLQRVPLADDGAGLPVHEVTVRGGRNHTVQTTGLVGIVGAARRARLAQPYQDAIARDPAVLVKHPLSPERTVETGFACVADAQREADRLLALYAVQRDRYECTISADDAALAALDLGAVLSLRYPRYGLDAGKLVRVLGYQLDPVRGSADLTVWG